MEFQIFAQNFFSTSFMNWLLFVLIMLMQLSGFINSLPPSTPRDVSSECCFFYQMYSLSIYDLDVRRGLAQRRRRAHFEAKATMTVAGVRCQEQQSDSYISTAWRLMLESQKEEFVCCARVQCKCRRNDDRLSNYLTLEGGLHSFVRLSVRPPQ